MTRESKKKVIVLTEDFIEWQWYKKPEMVHFFIHCLFKANTENKKVEGFVIRRGSFRTSLDILREEMGLSIQQLRSCIKKLVGTNELTSISTNKYRIITILNYDNYIVEQQANNNQINRQEFSTMQDYQDFCDSATSTSTNQLTGKTYNANDWNKTIYNMGQQASNKQTNNQINKHLQRKEQETKKAKESSPCTPYKEKEINKEKEKKLKVFFPHSCEKGVSLTQSGDGLQTPNEITDNNTQKNEMIEIKTFSKQSSNETSNFEVLPENDFSTTQKNEKSVNQNIFQSQTGQEKIIVKNALQEKEKSCDKKEKDLSTMPLQTKPSVVHQAVPVASWSVRLQQIKTDLLQSEWIDRVAMQFDIPTCDIRPIFESFCRELEATGEHSTSATPVAEIQKHFFYWTRLKKQKYLNRRNEKVNPAAILEQLKQMGI